MQIFYSSRRGSARPRGQTFICPDWPVCGYWYVTVMVLSTLARTSPRVRPVAVNVTGAEVLDTDSVEKERPAIEALEGSSSSTAEGTVNVSAEAGASQVKEPTTKSVTLSPMDPSERPVMPT